jgi:hypothetical protein
VPNSIQKISFGSTKRSTQRATAASHGEAGNPEDLSNAGSPKNFGSGKRFGKFTRKPWIGPTLRAVLVAINGNVKHQREEEEFV